MMESHDSYVSYNPQVIDHPLRNGKKLCKCRIPYIADGSCPTCGLLMDTTVVRLLALWS